MTFHVRAEFFNVMNRMLLAAPAGNPATTTTRNAAGQLTNGFGFINKQSTGGQRNGQLVARFDF